MCRFSAGGRFIAGGKKQFYLVKDSDVLPILITEKADIGFLGSDFYREVEQSPDGLQTRFESLGLHIGQMVLAVPQGLRQHRRDQLAGDYGYKPLRVATKYPVSLAALARRRGYHLDIKQSHSVEPMLAMGLSDLIFDTRDSGQTLKDNRLVVVQTAGKVCLGGVYKDLATWRTSLDEFQSLFGYNEGEV